MQTSSKNQPEPHSGPAVRSTLNAHTAPLAPHDGLKQAAMSFKDSGISYLQSKTELAAIEAQEAAEYTKKKLSLGLTVVLLGIFTYALFLILLHGMIIQIAEHPLAKITSSTGLNSSNIVLLLMFLLHLFFLVISMIKLSKKPEEELFALTKSEFQKDKQWLAEINQSNVN